MAKSRRYNDIKVGLNDADRDRLNEHARQQGLTQSEAARDGIRWYLDHLENAVYDKRESEVAQAIRYATEQLVMAIKNGVERVCKMLARQGATIGTLYELSWMTLPDDENARAVFQEAIEASKRKMRKYVQKDEAEIAEAMMKILEK
jgi:hypothetical protein